MSKKEKVGLYSAFILALVPVHIMWSPTTAAEPSFLFYTLLTVMFFLITFEIKTWKTYLLAAVSLSYAIQIKAEGVIVLPIIGLFSLLYDNKWFENLTKKEFLLI